MFEIQEGLTNSTKLATPTDKVFLVNPNSLKRVFSHNIICLQVKAKALVLAEMNSFLQKRFDEDDKIQRDLEVTFQELQRYVSS